MTTETPCEVTHLEAEGGSVPDVFLLVESVAKKLRSLQRQAIREADLTSAQYSVLSLLWDKDGRQLVELASGCCCSPSTITGIVDTLEEKGLVKREGNPEDRRSFLVTLTEQGRKLKDLTPSLDCIFEGCCGGVRPEEVSRLVELLRRLDQSLSV
jgi:DNA-binding MarR family transcriptional regulator